MASEKSRVKYKPYVYEMMGATLIKSLSGCLPCAVSAVKARNISVCSQSVKLLAENGNFAVALLIIC